MNQSEYHKYVKTPIHLAIAAFGGVTGNNITALDIYMKLNFLTNILKAQGDLIKRTPTNVTADQVNYIDLYMQLVQKDLDDVKSG